MVFYQKSTLDNGIRVISTTMPHVRSVTVSCFIGVGARYETAEQSGMSHFIEHLCFRGTSRRKTANEISTAIEGVGGILNGGTDKELTVYWAKVPRPHFTLALDVLTDMMLNSLFRPEDIERERQVIIEEINMSLDSPSQQVAMLIDELLWPNHPLGRDTAGTRETVTAITREMMLDYLQSHYLPANTIVAVAGNIEHGEAVETVSKYMAGWTNHRPGPDYSPYTGHENHRLRIETRSTEQAHLSIAVHGVPITHPKRFTMDLLNVILGEGMSSRLFSEIRDKLGLAYSIHSFSDYFLDTGALTVEAGVEPKNLKTAVKAIVSELTRLKELVPEQELNKAKELTKGRLLLRLEDTRNVASWLGGQETLMGHVLTIDEVVAMIDRVTAAGISELAEQFMVGEEMRLAVVGPVKESKTLRALLDG